MSKDTYSRAHGSLIFLSVLVSPGTYEGAGSVGDGAD